jgi:DNA modification methylase
VIARNPIDGASVYVGDCRELMDAVLQPKSVHTVVTSPPYWVLRNYGIAPSRWCDGWVGVYGNEPTVEQYVNHTLEVFSYIEVVLRDDGVIWWNLGDSWSKDGGSGAPGGSSQRKGRTRKQSNEQRKTTAEAEEGSKLMIAHRVALALEDAGWVVRMDNVWHKPGPMPSSVFGWQWEQCRRKVSNGDEGVPLVNGSKTHSGHISNSNQAKWEECPGCRKCEATGGLILRKGRWNTTCAHEFVLMVTKPGVYYCDQMAALEPVSGGAHGRGDGLNPKAVGEGRENGVRANREWAASHNDMMATRNPRSLWKSPEQEMLERLASAGPGDLESLKCEAARLLGDSSIWRIVTEPSSEPHFAMFPGELARRCIAVSTSKAGCCPSCGVSVRSGCLAIEGGDETGEQDQSGPCQCARRVTMSGSRKYRRKPGPAKTHDYPRGD